VLRGRSYEEAVAILEYMPYKACEPVLACLKSAGANGKNGKNVPLSRQYVSEAMADQGPVLKRFRPRAQGR
jgi:large subunit ribosomal protein L22